MNQISYKRHRFPAEIIQHAVWLYCRFTLSFRDVEDFLAERGLDVSYESVRCWVLKFGAAYARAFSGLTDSFGGFPKFRESDSRGRLVKEASLYDPTSFD